MKSMFYRWYSEGIYTIPPPCFYSRTFRKYFSNNHFGGPLSCMKVAQWGNDWGTENRPYIMFFAFWLSMLGFFLLIIPFLALSYNPNVIKFAHWMKASQQNYEIIDKHTNNTIYEDINIYAGTFILVQDCSNDMVPCDLTSRWTDSDTCEGKDGNFCEECAKICLGTFTTAFFGLLSMIPQILVDLQRSTEAGDLNCQKYIGQFSALFGGISTLLALLQFYFGCYIHIIDALKLEGKNYQVEIGAAYICVLIATLLKPFDFWAHWVIPVPNKHWDPDHPEYWDEKHRKIIKNYSADEESGLIYANKPLESFKNKQSLYNTPSSEFRNNNQHQIYINDEANSNSYELNQLNLANN